MGVITGGGVHDKSKAQHSKLMPVLPMSVGAASFKDDVDEEDEWEKTLAEALQRSLEDQTTTNAE